MANEIGKRYFCSSCGSEMIVTKAGAGILKCGRQEMVKKS